MSKHVLAVIDDQIGMHWRSLPEFQSELDDALAARASIVGLLDASSAAVDALIHAGSTLHAKHLSDAIMRAVGQP